MSPDDVIDLKPSTRSDRLSARLQNAKSAFTTRNVRLGEATSLVRSGVAPRPGDVVLARVASVGQHPKIENVHGRRVALYPGDEVIVAFGNRYAPDQFEAYLPEALGVCDLVAGGGVAAVSASKHSAMKAPTRIETIGLLGRDDETILNLRDFTIATPAAGRRPATVIAVVGTSMNAGKTTTVASLIRGLTGAGFRVGAAKLTGTGSGGDLWSMLDAGAVRAVDFTDAGHASTFGCSPVELETIVDTLLTTLAADVDLAIVEVADGLLQTETEVTIEMACRRGLFDGVVFAAADAMGAAFGIGWLGERQITPLVVSGLVTASPLASVEASLQFGIPLATIGMLSDPIEVTKIVFSDRSDVGAAA